MYSTGMWNCGPLPTSNQYKTSDKKTKNKNPKTPWMQGIQSCLNEGSRTFPREDIDNRGEQKKFKNLDNF